MMLGFVGAVQPRRLRAALVVAGALLAPAAPASRTTNATTCRAVCRLARVRSRLAATGEWTAA